MKALKSFIIALTCTGCIAATHRQNQPLAVEFWVGGDDGATERFANELKRAFRSDTSFAVLETTSTNHVQIVIESNVNYKELPAGDRISYKIKFMRQYPENAVSLGKSSGSCLADQLQICAAKALRDARVALLRHR